MPSITFIFHHCSLKFKSNKNNQVKKPRRADQYIEMHELDRERKDKQWKLFRVQSFDGMTIDQVSFHYYYLLIPAI